MKLATTDDVRLRVFQNNKALKLNIINADAFNCLRVFQNNKALKPQIRSKATRCRAVILLYKHYNTCILTLSCYIFNYFA